MQLNNYLFLFFFGRLPQENARDLNRTNTVRCAPFSEVSPQAGEENNNLQRCYHDSVREKKAQHFFFPKRNQQPLEAPRRLKRSVQGRAKPGDPE